MLFEVGACGDDVAATQTVQCVGPPCECVDDVEALRSELGDPIATCADFSRSQGCTQNAAGGTLCPVTCGNSNPLKPPAESAISDKDQTF